MQAKRILLTGGGGFVGTWLAPLLVSASPNADRLMLTHHIGGNIQGWSVEKCDLLDRAAVNSVVRNFRPDLVIHMAAQSSVGASTYGAIDTWDVNFNGSFLIAGACARFVPDAVFFFTSSAEVYGYAMHDGAVMENAPLLPVSSYGRSKAATEKMLPDVLSNANKLIITRAFNHTGPGQDDRFVIPSFARQIVKIERGEQDPVIQVGNLEAARDFLDVRDVCRAYISILERSQSLPRATILNVSSGEAHRIIDLLSILKSHSIREFGIERDPTRLRPSDIPSSIGIAKALNDLSGWEPKHKIADTLRDILEYERGR